MARSKAFVCILVLAAAVLLGGRGSVAAEPLEVDTVLATSARHAPQILESLAREDAARGGIVSADGAFDTTVRSEGFGRFSGFWNGRVIDNTVSQDLRAIGATVFGGYRVSDGAFPIYEDVNFTNTGGEIKAGFILSLLRDRAFNDQLAGVVDADLGLTKAQIDVLSSRIRVQHKALRAHRTWVAAGGQLRVYQDLLQLGLDRETALERRVAEGDAAEVLLIENRQNILRRETLVVEAERQVAASALALSMYYRGEDGRPIVPDIQQLPESLPEITDDVLTTGDDTEAIAMGQALRPELAVVDNNLAKARNALRLARNELKPKLDFSYEVSRDFGAVAEGGISRDSTDNILGIKFEVPLQRRFARGKIAEARSEMQALEFERQYLQEQIAVEIRVLSTDLQAAQRIFDLAVEEQTQAETMQDVELTRFERGISDFFLLNVREERTADARVRRIVAQLRYFIALADYSAAIVDLETLGIQG